MSNEEKLKRDRHQRIRKIWSIIFMVEILLDLIALAAMGYLYYDSSKVIYTEYDSTPTAEYSVLLNNDKTPESGQNSGLITADVKQLNVNFKYKTDVKAQNVSYAYSYVIEKFIIVEDRQHGEVDPKAYEDEGLYSASEAVTGTSNAIDVALDPIMFQDENTTAQKFMEKYGLTSGEARLCIKMTIEMTRNCPNFGNNPKQTITLLLEAELLNEFTSIQNLSDAARTGEKIESTKDSYLAIAMKMAMLPTAIFVTLVIIAFVIFLTLTRNKDVDYANKIKSILRGYKSFIQVSTSKFTSNGFVVYKIGTIKEMLEIRDTIQKPVIMIENEDKTCSKFFIVDNEVMYLHGICVEGYEHLLDEEKKEPENTPEVIVPTPVEEVVEEEVQDEAVSEIVEEDDEALARLYNLCNYTFEAKLILAEDQMKEFYREIAEFALSYGVKVVRSAKRERIYLGRKLFANLTFSGKKLCVAMPLNPADYADSKYKFKDMSEVKKFADTPFVMKVTSGLKVRHIKELLTKMFEAEGLENKNLDIKVKKIPTKSKKTLIKEGLIKVSAKEIK